MTNDRQAVRTGFGEVEVAGETLIGGVDAGEAGSIAGAARVGGGIVVVRAWTVGLAHAESMESTGQAVGAVGSSGP